jgi:polysaccharide pyruvyl transferase WcaK-like protein
MRNTSGFTSAARVESAIAGMDVILTTRLHGMVLALKKGVPAVVVDPVSGAIK